MKQPEHWTIPGKNGHITVSEWPNDNARYTAVLVHGYGEHMGRYPGVAMALLAAGAAVAGPDHIGHGRSDGERVLVEDFHDVVADIHSVVTAVSTPERPTVLIGHSMGGMLAARYAQLHGEVLRALVLSGPVLGSWTQTTSLLDLDEIPDAPLDVSTLSRDQQVGVDYAADPLVWHGPFKRPTVAAFDRFLRAINEGGRLGALPTMWIHGGEDRLVPIDETRIGIANIRGDRFTERIYPGARHEVFNETNRDEVLADVIGFIDDVLS